MNDCAKEAEGQGARRTIADWLPRVPGEGVRSVAVLEHGTMLAKLYAPRGSDPTSVHFSSAGVTIRWSA